MPTLPLSLLTEHSIAPFRTTSRVSHLESTDSTAACQFHVRTQLSNIPSHPNFTPFSTTWTPNFEFRCCPLFRIPTPIYFVSRPSISVHQCLDRATPQTGITHQSFTALRRPFFDDRNIALNVSSSSNIFTESVCDSASSLVSCATSFRGSHLNAPYGYPAVLCPMFEPNTLASNIISGVSTSSGVGIPIAVSSVSESSEASYQGIAHSSSFTSASHCAYTADCPNGYAPRSPNAHSMNSCTTNSSDFSQSVSTRKFPDYSAYRDPAFICQEAFENEPSPLFTASSESENFHPCDSRPHVMCNSFEGKPESTAAPENDTSKTSMSNSSFLFSSFSDIPLTNLEELLARSSIDDVYLGPVKGSDGTTLSLDPSIRTVNQCLSLPYSSTSLAFTPPGVIMVSELWFMFLNDRLSMCNHRIHSMTMDVLRKCLYDHGLNQLGSIGILRRRLQEFVRRVRDAYSSNRFHFTDGLNSQVDSLASLSDSIIDVCDPMFACQLEATDVNLNPNGLSTTDDRMIKLSKPVILTPDTFYSYLLIIDLEATCDFQERRHTAPEYPHEIIEFPVLLYNTRTRRCVSVFHAYCKPKLHPDLTTFCTNLTQISQVQVDEASPFSQVLTKVESWLFKQHRLSDVRCAIVCDCSADMSKFMRIQCRLDQIPLPSWASVWINLSRAFRIFYKLPSRHRVTLSTMLHDLNLSFIGQQHRGLDDAINILRIVRTMLADGCLLRVNERVDFGRPPNYVTSVPRLVAEATSGRMGSRLILLSCKSRTNSSTSSYNGKDDQRISLPTDVPEDHRQSLLWLARVQRTRVTKD